MTLVFYLLIAAACVMAALRQLGWLAPLNSGGSGAMAAATGPAAPMDALGKAALSAAEQGVTLGLGLIGALALFLGLMKIAEAAGLMTGLARLLRPLLARLFPSVPATDPALGEMVMNVAANMIGLSNAATPFGLKAMRGLDRLNPQPLTASNAMVLFLALNTANVTLLPTHVMALRTAVGSLDPAIVIGTTLLSTSLATGLALLGAWLGGRVWPVRPAAGAVPSLARPAESDAVPLTAAGVPDSGPAADFLPPLSPLRALLGGGLLLGGLIGLVALGSAASPWILPGLIFAVLTCGLLRKVPLYSCFVDGAREGLTISLQILPALVAILVAVGMFRSSGAMDAVIGPLSQLTTPLGLPGEALTMVLLRSLSGSASFGYLAALLKDPAIGPDSYLGVLVSTIYGSSETTFYVLAVYVGATRVRSVRHALLVGLLADAGGALGAVLACRWLLPG